MKKINLDNIKRVRFCDYTEYDSNLCNNGGCYGFWTDYNRLENGKWEVSYGTTADFEYCPVSPDFHSSTADRCGDCATVTDTELLKLIEDFVETDDEYIEYK